MYDHIQLISECELASLCLLKCIDMSVVAVVHSPVGVDSGLKRCVLSLEQQPSEHIASSRYGKDGHDRHGHGEMHLHGRAGGPRTESKEPFRIQ